MLILAHRGLHGPARENTLEAFSAAAALGVGVETDVRLDKNGVPFLLHDPRLENGLEVARHGLAALREAAGFHIPSLEEALEACPGLFWNLELKTEDAAAPVAHLLRRRGGRDEILISSFLHRVALDCAAACGKPAGLLLAHRPLQAPSILAGASPGAVQAVIWQAAMAEAEGLKQIAALRVENWLYGFTAPEEHERALALGGPVNAIITDFSASARQDRQDC